MSLPTIENNNRVAKANIAFGTLYKRVWSSKHPKKGTKISVYRAVALSTPYSTAPSRGSPTVTTYAPLVLPSALAPHRLSKVDESA